MSRRRTGKKRKQSKLNNDHTTVKRRRQKKPQSQTPPSSESIINPDDVVVQVEQENNHQLVEPKDNDGGNSNRFYGCYLLTSLSPRFKGHSYIGFTVNPKRRIRQHNGEITSGAFSTKKKRPWEMVLCIHGFPSNVSALQFEWAWQHPRKSIAVREAAASFKTLAGLANKIKLALTMLTLHSWQSMKLTVSFFSTKYMNHAAGCPSLPHQMKLHFCSMDELPCYGDLPFGQDDEDDFDSNDSGVSADNSDDRLEAPADDSMETNLSSEHVQSCIVQNSSDNIMAGDLGTGGSWESESSSVVDLPEENMQPVHQLPVEDYTVNTSNELFWSGEEYWNEDYRGFSPCSEEHSLELPLIGSVSTSEYLDEKQLSCHLPAEEAASTRNDLSEHLRLHNESGTKVLSGSADDSMEMNLSSKHIQSCIVQNSSDNIMAGDHIGTGGSWESESSSVVDLPEEHMQPVHQLPVEVNGSMLNSSIELFWSGEEYWNEDYRGFSPYSEEHLPELPLTGSFSTSEYLEEKQPSCHLPAEEAASTRNDLDEQLRPHNKSGIKELSGSVYVIEEEEHIQPLQQVGLDREESAVVGVASMMEDAARKDETTCIVIDDISEEQCNPTRVRSPFRVANTNQTLSTEGIEVIELCTPSPDLRITKRSKKKRADSGFPDIIDLTRSPPFVQL